MENKLTLEEHLIDIQKKLQANEYPNEQSISQGIVLRILQAIGWPLYDTQLVMPEYSIEGLRVDFALCHHAGKPLIFIEVKQPGKIAGADKQLFQYCYHAGIPFAIVTDGKEWHFYLPAEAGSYEERRVYKLDLLEREIQESSFRFMRYLNLENVRNGLALEKARKDYKNVSKKRQTKANIPLAWEKLLEEKDEMLIEVMSEKVESICGYKPTDLQIVQFLKSLSIEIPKPSHTTITKAVSTKYLQDNVKETSVTNNTKTYSHKRTSTRKKLKVTFSDGTEICLSNVANTMVEVIRKIGFEKVKSLGIEMYGCPLVSHTKLKEDKYGWSTAEPNMHIFTHSNTNKKVAQLREINDGLTLGLIIEKV